jgi:hemoglobin
VVDNKSFCQKGDIAGRPEIEALVNEFYQRVRSDEILGHIFDEIAKTHWPSHLPKMYAFWETVLFRSGGYSGNPLDAHARLTSLTAMGRVQFDRWLDLFRGTVDDLFTGARAEHIKNCAADMANVIHARINKVPDARFDPANLTPERRERYARYRAKSSLSTTQPTHETKNALHARRGAGFQISIR